MYRTDARTSLTVPQNGKDTFTIGADRTQSVVGIGILHGKGARHAQSGLGAACDHARLLVAFPHRLHIVQMGGQREGTRFHTSAQ